MMQVLDLLGFEPQERAGAQVRGACPVHRSQSAQSRSFSANLDDNVYRCFRCGSSGGTLELWAAVHGIGVFAAAKDLGEKLHLEVPWVHRW
jgi:DNA primase